MPTQLFNFLPRAMFGVEISPTFVVMLTLFMILLVKLWSQTSDVKLPPCPVWPLPILGHLPYMAKDPRAKIMAWSKTSGEIFSVYFGPKLVIVLSSYDVLKETLVKQANIFTDKSKTSMFPAIIPVVSGIIETSGQVWKENRTTVVSGLKSFRVGSNIMAEKVNEEISCYLKELDSLSGKPADVKNITSRAVSNIICNFLLGKRFDYEDESYAKMLEIYDRKTQSAVAAGMQMWFPAIKYLPEGLTGVNNLREDDEGLLRFGRAFINQVENDTASDVNHESIISFYLKEMQDKLEDGKATSLDNHHLERLVSDLLVAGSETATSTLLWFYLYMIHNPKIQNKIHTEIDNEIGNSRAPTIADKAKLTYLNAAIMETQRISSIVPLGLFHRCTEETTVRGYTVPKDTLVMPHLDSALLSEAIWGDPLNFRPDRFIDGKGNLTNPEEFVPFSMGRRLCLGESLAKTELFLFISK